MLFLTFEDVGRSIPPQYVERGFQVWRENRVIAVRADIDDSDKPAQILARVQGSGHRTYDLQILLFSGHAGTRIDGVCTCPVGFNCKHVAAVLISVLATPPEQGAAPDGGVGPAALQQHIVDEWLGTLVTALRLPAQAGAVPPHAPLAQLVYVLAPPQEGAANSLLAPLVELRLRKPRKGGGFSKGAELALDDLLSADNDYALLDEDRELVLRWLMARSGPSASFHPQVLNFPASGDLLAGMIATGRCHWLLATSAPLRRGDARPASTRWVMLPDGSQRATLSVEPAGRVIAVEPLWYVDEASLVAGPLKLNVPEPVVRHLVAGPPLRAEQISQVRKALDPWQAVLPLPAALQTRKLGKVRPVPVLRLSTAAFQGTLMGGGGVTAAHGACGYLTFDYGGQQVDPRLSQGEVSSVASGDFVYAVPRDLPQEQAAADQLAQWHMRPLPSYRLGGPSAHPGILVTPHGRAADSDGEQQWFRFVMEGVAALQEAGWRVHYEPDFPHRLAQPQEWYLNLEEGSDSRWFDMELGIQIDGNTVNLLPLLVDAIQRVPGDFAAARLDKLSDNDFILLRTDDGRALPLPVERVRNILRVLVELYDPTALGLDGRMRFPAMRAAELTPLAAGVGMQEGRWYGPARLRELNARLADFSGIKQVSPSQSFRAQLRHYQQEGLNWLQFLREYDFAGILADDMGLGKTVQTLAHLAVEKDAGRMGKPTLIVAPTSLMGNWRREAERFAPTLRVLVLHGAARREQFGHIPEFDVVLTTYALLVRDDQALLVHEYYYVILDEAQYIKNPKTKATLVAQQLRAGHRLCLTGTPMENHLGELWSVMHFLMPGLLGDERRFTRLFRTPIEKYADAQRQKLLRERINPFLLRRTKEIVATELPPKTEIVRNVTLEGAQRDLYETIRVAMQEKVQRAIAQKGLNRSHIEILEALLKLRQVCCDPRLVKLDAAKRVKQSAKLELLMDMLPELIAEGRRVLVFSQFTSMLKLIEAQLDKQQIGYAKLTGETTDRSKAIKRFEDGTVPLFLISLKAGGTGLNLTSADTVIHYDPWWNPAVERQATDRAHRIGQDKPVFVYKLLTEGTVEERIGEMQARKQALADGLLAGDDHGMAALTAADLAGLFSPLA